MPHLSVSSWDSLERKLPLLIGGLVVVSVLATFAVVRLDLRESAVDGAGERLARVAQQLAGLAAASADQRHDVLAAATRNPAILAAARGEAVDPDALHAALEEVRIPADSARPILLLDAAGTIVASTGGDPRAGVEGALPYGPQADLVLADTITYSRLHQVDGSGAYWIAVPVIDGGRAAGHVVQHRTFGSAAAREQLQALFGGQIEVVLANEDGTNRVLLDGSVLPGAMKVDTTGSVFHRVSLDGTRLVSYATPLRQGWILAAELPLAAVVARATEVKRRLLAVGLLLLLLGGVAAWLVSRSVTRPLRRLANAADAIASGDYSRRTGLSRDDEIGHLARSFDAMAGYVDATHAELARRYDEAQHLASELEVANARLHEVVSELELAQRQALEASAAKSGFLATMSHEIRTPINAMIGYTDLLELGVPGPLTEQQREFIGRIRLSGEHLMSIVNDVLDFAKIESGRLHVQHDVLSAAAVAREAIAMMQARAASRGVRVEVGCGPDATVLADRQRLHQIVLNLLSNALKFTPEGGTVTVSCDSRSSRALAAEDGAAKAEWTCIVVTDTGVGIPPDQRETIFEPFVQGTAGYTRPHGGTGLGLAISRSLARMMGGDLTVESEPGRGASFTVWLPAASRARQPA